jgi:hypothetical protein
MACQGGAPQRSRWVGRHTGAQCTLHRGQEVDEGEGLHSQSRAFEEFGVAFITCFLGQVAQLCQPGWNTGQDHHAKKSLYQHCRAEAAFPFLRSRRKGHTGQPTKKPQPMGLRLLYTAAPGSKLSLILVCSAPKTLSKVSSVTFTALVSSLDIWVFCTPMSAPSSD